MAKSKYAVGVNSIRTMNDSELDKFIKLGTKNINSRFKRNTQLLGKKAVFSEFIDAFNETSGRFYGETRNFSGAVKGKTRSEKQQIAYAINLLSSIDETVRDVEEEYKENLDNIFGNPEITKKVLDSLENDKVIQMGRDNMEIIYDILGSDRVNSAAQKFGNDSYNFYYELITNTSEIMNEYLDPEEIEKVVKKWDYPE